jgi:hypothetical protein
LIVALLLCGSTASAADLKKIPRSIGKEPAYTNKPRYALAVFGADAKFRVWLVLDGDVLYVDKNGNGDLTEAGEKHVGKKDRSGEIHFKIGDINVGSGTYADMEVRVGPLSDYQEEYADSPQFAKILAVDPTALHYSVNVDVPVSQPLKDDKGRVVKSLKHYVLMADANGILQFAKRSEDAPIFHFGGAWSIWPSDRQKLILGRSEEFTARIGTPGLGPGTLAIIQYHTLGDDAEMFVPKDARVAMDIQVAGKDGKPIVSRQALDDRC